MLRHLPGREKHAAERNSGKRGMSIEIKCVPGIADIPGAHTK